MSVRVVNNRAQMQIILSQNIRKALTALGIVIVETVISYMEHNYPRRIYDTGTLIRSITYEVDTANKKLTIGTNLNYGPWVHAGTRRMAARPFLYDAIIENLDVWQEVLKRELGQGWTVGAFGTR